MSIQSRIDIEYSALLTHRIVQSTELIRRTTTELDGYLRVRNTLTNSDFLEVAIHIQLDKGQTFIDGYRYQWMDSTRTALKRRWDNTAHFPELPGFPHHCHVGSETVVEPSQPMDINSLLETIASLIGA